MRETHVVGAARDRTLPRTARTAARVRVRLRLSGLALHATVILLCAIWLVPTINLIVTSLRPAASLLSSGWWHVLGAPEQLTLSNYVDILSDARLGDSFVNSLLVVVPVTVLTVLIGAIAGYAFAWIPFPGERVVLLLLVGLLALPVQVTLVPVLELFASLDLAGTFAAAWIAYPAYMLPFAIYLMRSFFRQVPREILEASAVDGATPIATWLRVAFPIAAPALASLGTLVFVWTWNDLLVALVFLGSSPDVAPLPVTIANLIGSQGQGQELIAAGAVISLIVPLLVFFALQRYFVRGIVAGAVKG